MKISYFKFADEKLGYGHTVRDMTDEELQREFKYLETCADIDKVGGFGGCDQSMWHDGYYRCAGYEFRFENPVRVLVNDGFWKCWWPRYVPVRDDRLVEKYIREFDSDVERWIYVDDDVHHILPTEE